MNHIRQESSTVLTPKTPMLCLTKGDSYWSHADATTVSITKLEMEVGEAYVDLYQYTARLPIYLKAFFPKKSWNTDKYGLIYTDTLWVKHFRAEFKAQFPAFAWMASKIDYTEQGMQGDNYVSLAVHLESMEQIKRFNKSLAAMPKLTWNVVEYAD